MRRTITFTIMLDDETARIYSLDATENIYNRTEFVEDGVDDPVSINDAINCIREELKNKLVIED